MKPESQSPSLPPCLRLFQVLDPAGQQRVLGSLETVAYQDGARIFEEGTAGDALYIIISGKVEVSADDLGEQKVLGHLGEGCMFGEMAVITNQPRSATVTAAGPVSAYRITKDTMLAVLKDYPRLKELIARVGVSRAEDTLGKLSC